MVFYKTQFLFTLLQHPSDVTGTQSILLFFSFLYFKCYLTCLCVGMQVEVRG